MNLSQCEQLRGLNLLALASELLHRADRTTQTNRRCENSPSLGYLANANQEISFVSRHCPEPRESGCRRNKQNVEPRQVKLIYLHNQDRSGIKWDRLPACRQAGSLSHLSNRTLIDRTVLSFQLPVALEIRVVVFSILRQLGFELEAWSGCHRPWLANETNEIEAEPTAPR